MAGAYGTYTVSGSVKERISVGPVCRKINAGNFVASTTTTRDEGDDDDDDDDDYLRYKF